MATQPATAWQLAIGPTAAISMAVGAALTGLFRNLPEAVPAVVVLVAVKGLIDLRELAHVWRVSRFDFHVAMAALLGVLLLGIKSARLADTPRWLP